jgi:hypothetical protein
MQRASPSTKFYDNGSTVMAKCGMRGTGYGMDNGLFLMLFRPL